MEGFSSSDVETSGFISMVCVMNCNLEPAKLSRLHPLIIFKFRTLVKMCTSDYCSVVSGD
jgi:hypothetical protein